jgi:hypothetical protein
MKRLSRQLVSTSQNQCFRCGKRDADLRAALGNRFPKHIYHTIVCIGALVAHRESRRGRWTRPLLNELRN